MRWLLLSTFALVACAPWAPIPEPAPGVTFTATEHAGYTVYRLEVNPPVERAFLRFVGEDLRVTDAPECALVEGALECILGRVESFVELPVAGTVTNDPALPFGVVCRNECYALHLSRGP